MIGNSSALINDSIIHYPISDSNLSFSHYIRDCRTIIESRRSDLQEKNARNYDLILDANSPFELYPDNTIKANGRFKYGALLIHGLFDCPFTFRDMGKQLQSKGIFSRAILLPGHGTTPDDLLHVSYHDWIQAVRYGLESLRKEADNVFLVGYSTGAALSVYQALQDDNIAGLVLLAPAIKIKAPVDTIFNLRQFVKWMTNNRQWIYRDEEVDYSKYRSIGFNPVTQLNNLTEVVDELHRFRPLSCPVLMIISREDETISSHTAIDFFSSLPNKENKLLLYTAFDRRYPDSRIAPRLTHYPELQVNHFSHVGIPFAPDNPHYGQHGDFIYASHIKNTDVIYGAYNRIEENSLNMLYKLNLVKYKRRQLTYNPDFDYMVNTVTSFILKEETR